MPNWCSNALVVRGTTSKDVRDFVKNDKLDFDFDKVIPYPEKYSDKDRIAHEYAVKYNALEGFPESRLLLIEEYKKYIPNMVRPWHIPDGYNTGGYEWCRENWGTKWNACETNVEEDGKDVVYFFDTAWAPPVPVIAKLAEMFPECEFTLTWDEPGMMLEGIVVWENGICVKDEEREMVFDENEEE